MKNRKLFLFAAIVRVAMVTGQLAQAATFSAPVLFASGSTVGANVSGPDSIAVGNGSVWVRYVPSTTPSTNFSGTSTVVQYSTGGAIQNMYTLAGSVDGLKIDPSTGLVWALQNQDGDSQISIINPVAKTVTPYTYTPPVSATQGFDDVVFANNKIYLSYTNPVAGTDPVLQTLGGLSQPLSVTPIATYSASPSTLNDPDSLKQDSLGNLVLSSGDDGALNFFNGSGGFERALSITNNGNSVTGLDDSFFPTGGSGILYFTDTNTNGVYSVAASNLVAGSIFASVGGAKAIGQVDPGTGAFTPVITDGASNSAPHGIAFLATPEPGSAFLLAGGALLLLVSRFSSRR